MSNLLPNEANLLSGAALIVEDNMIIAMEAEQILLSLGATQCHIAGNVEHSLSLIEEVGPSFGLIDVNLGNETSEPVTIRLRELQTPFVIASGYGDHDKAHPALASAPSVTKPYTEAQIAAAIVAAKAQYDGGKG